MARIKDNNYISITNTMILLIRCSTAVGLLPILLVLYLRSGADMISIVIEVYKLLSRMGAFLFLCNG